MQRRKPRDKRLYWRGGKLWCRVPGPAGRIVRKATHCVDETAAGIRADEFERRYADPRHAAAAAATFERGVRALLADMRRRGSSASTLAIAGQKLGHFVRLWGTSLSMADISPSLVLAYVDQRQREPGRGGTNVKDFTIKKELEHLRQLLVVARHAGAFHLDPAVVMPPFFAGGHVPRKRKLTIEESSRLVAQFERGRAAHLCFIAGTGARRSEAARARREDVHLDEGFVHIRGTKTEIADDDVPITSITRPIVESAVDGAPGRDLLFAPWGNLTRDLAAGCKRAGLDPVTPNDLRRSFASWHRDAGVPAEVVSKLLRHTTDKLAQTTYAKLAAPAVGRLVEAVLSGVPGLYPDAVPNAPNGSERDPENTEKPRATLGNRTPDLRFTKPKEQTASNRIKTGMYSAAQTAGVPVLYRNTAAARAFRALAWIQLSAHHVGAACQAGPS